MRDEVYAFEIVFLLKNGKQTSGFHIPGRSANGSDLYPVPPTNNDFIGEPEKDEKDARFVNQSSRDGDTLHLPTTQFVGAMVGSISQVHLRNGR